MFTTVNTFNEWLQHELDQRDWTQADLARAAKISKSGISMIFTQDRQPGTEVCLAIADALKIPPEIVYRKAGLLPPKPEQDERTERLIHLFSQLEQVDQEEVIEFTELKLKRADQRSEAARLLAEIESLPPEKEKEIIELFETWLESRGARRTR